MQSILKINTDNGNYEGFTKNDVGKAISDSKSQAMIGAPSEKEFKELVSGNCTALKYIPMTCANITNAHTIFGTDLLGVQGKNMRQKPARLEYEETYVPRFLWSAKIRNFDCRYDVCK